MNRNETYTENGGLRLSKVLERTKWETRVGYTFIVTSLLAFVFVLFLPGILFQELLVWVPFQVWLLTMSMYSPSLAWGSIALNPQLMLGPNTFLLAYPYFSLVLISFGGFGLVAAFGLLRTKKWRTPTSIAFAFLAACLTLFLFGWFDMITVPKETIQIITAIIFIIYACVLFSITYTSVLFKKFVAHIFVVTSLSAFVMVLLLPLILFQEMLAWVSLLQVGLWAILATTPLTFFELLDQFLHLYLFIGVLKPHLAFGPEILYPHYYFSRVLFSSLVLVTLGVLGLVAAFGLLRTKKWGTHASFVFSLLAWFLALYMFQSFEMLTVPRSTIQFAALPLYALYFYIWVTFMSKIMPKKGEKEKNAGGTPPT